MNYFPKYPFNHIFWHGIGTILFSSDLFKEYLSKLLLETGSRGIRPVSFFFIPTLSQDSNLHISVSQLIFILLCSNLVNLL